MAAYIGLGDSVETAFKRAHARVQRIKAEMRDLARTPHQGTLHPHILPGLRNVTKDRAIFYFTVDDERAIVRVLAVFYGGQDHQRAMLLRAAGGAP